MMSNNRDAVAREGWHGHRAGAASTGWRPGGLRGPRAAGCGRLLGVAFQILGDSDLAEEATHIAVINAWRKLPALREPERFEAWLYRLVVNACRDEVRRRPWEVHAPVPLTWAIDATEPERQVDDRDRLERAFRRLSFDHRAVIVLHHHAGLSLVEVGRALESPPERFARDSTTRCAPCVTHSNSMMSCQRRG